jgi:hypothetical protein
LVFVRIGFILAVCKIIAALVAAASIAAASIATAFIAAAFVARHNMGTCIVRFKGCLFLNFVG